MCLSLLWELRHNEVVNNLQVASLLSLCHCYLTIIFIFFFLEIGEKGFPLPLVDGVQLVNPEVTRGQVKNVFRFCKIGYQEITCFTFIYAFAAIFNRTLHAISSTATSCYYVYVCFLFLCLRRTMSIGGWMIKLLALTCLSKWAVSNSLGRLFKQILIN